MKPLAAPDKAVSLENFHNFQGYGVAPLEVNFHRIELPVVAVVPFPVFGTAGVDVDGNAERMRTHTLCAQDWPPVKGSPDVGHVRSQMWVGYQFIGKNYDLTFEWSDDKIYCSELIWKVYQRGAGIELGKLEKLSSFDLSAEAVKRKMKERYGAHIPMDETVISPAAVFESERLIQVQSN